ncbi:hypothetical protein [Sphingomonas kyungheensis]|uniref:Tetratricopeptide repeat protein n=1 Tax=Sphingomonas kyungheensis TaxID=1069987 RepID=A0ABU8GYM6_9SPHN
MAVQRFSAGLIGLAMLAAAPAAAETLHVTGVFAAGARDASRLSTIAVGPFGGADGAALGDAIERRLRALDREPLPHVRVIAASLRPDAVLTGRTSVGVVDDAYREPRERCAETKDGKCVRRQRYSVGCIRRTVTLRADLTLDGRGRYAPVRTRDDRHDWCEDGGVPGNVAASVAAMIESVAAETRDDLAPKPADYTIRLDETRDGLPPPLAARFKAAVRLTKHDSAAACAAFAAIDQDAPDHGPTMYDLALCAEAAGRYGEAADRYLRARVLLPRAGGEISRGLARVASLAAGAEDVAALRRLPPVVGSGL